MIGSAQRLDFDSSIHPLHPILHGIIAVLFCLEDNYSHGWAVVILRGDVTYLLDIVWVKQRTDWQPGGND